MAMSTSATGSHEIHIPAASGRSFEAKAGEFITLIDLEGQQIGDFVAFNTADRTERLSTCYTRSMLGRIYVRQGDRMYTNLRRPILEIVEDKVGRHDILIPACDRVRYEVTFGIANHRNCLDNLSAALAAYDIEQTRVPEPFNIFQNTAVDAEGNFNFEAARSKPGDRLVMRALMDLFGAVSACAMDQLPVNGWKLTPLLLVIGPQVPE
jgi:uncharacterized protein YcgI (DUF1989 family)